jgi:N-acyl-D-aspartate/D-glutamate deacylase
MWMRGKQGWNLDRLKRKLNIEDFAFNRTLADMTVERCPQENWQGMDFQAVFDRVGAIKQDQYAESVTKAEQKLIQKDFSWIADEGDFMLQMLRTFDTDLSWSTVTANRDIKVVRELLMNPKLLPGFNDSGAHLTNMAFYDVNLRSLKLAAEGGDGDVSYMVKRLTKDAADVFGVAGGTIHQGDIADLILIDPEQLANYDGENNVQRVHREEFQHEQLVNRSDSVVPLVMIGGHTAWENNNFASDLGQKPMGRLLRAI